MNFLARETLFRGAFGRLIAWFDAIPLQREGLGIAGLKESLRRLKRGEMLLIFPEGTRTTNGAMQPLEFGFVALARRAKVPIVPVAIDGAFQAWPRDQKWPSRYPVRIVVGEMIPSERIMRLGDEQIVAEVDQRLRACWKEARMRTEAALADRG
jgi:1-acyl-sn-glycerol-3-phosphate acyltransferase